ncbi:hypothetical protein WN48_05945 [Eufriesea mexicana]|nr:hypothetical protein WN48_05945 [Eufriesea mexicana]
MTLEHNGSLVSHGSFREGTISVNRLYCPIQKKKVKKPRGWMENGIGFEAKGIFLRNFFAGINN